MFFFQIGIGIAIAISISDEDRDRDKDLNFGDRGHALLKYIVESGCQSCHRGQLCHVEFSLGFKTKSVGFPIDLILQEPNISVSIVVSLKMRAPSQCIFVAHSVISETFLAQNNTA